ncbi:MAG: hypothetical protein IPM53_07915 [Anaerolineaceae bacterium]|nr:hypothetical protein [Anaerolineaceae bacterium]
MNQKMQQYTPWHPLGIQGETLQDGPVSTVDQKVQLSRLGWQTAVPPATFLTIDQSQSCGFRRNARVINF